MRLGQVALEGGRFDAPDGKHGDGERVSAQWVPVGAHESAPSCSIRATSGRSSAGSSARKGDSLASIPVDSARALRGARRRRAVAGFDFGAVAFLAAMEHGL